MATVLLAVGLLLVSGSRPSHAAGVVGNGTPASCTEAAFDATRVSGGTVTFNCGSAPHTIILTSLKTNAVDTTIDGGDLITLSGANASSLFQVFVNTRLTLKNLTLTRASGTFGAIQNFGTLETDNVRIVDNVAQSTGGAIDNFGIVTLRTSVVATNTVGTNSAGGGISNDGGNVTLIGTQVFNNSGPGESRGGGVFNSGQLTATSSLIAGNRAAHGGGIYNSGVLTLTDVQIENNLVTYAGPAHGGGLYHAGIAADLTSVRFEGNTTNSGYGGGLFVRWGSTMVISASTFTRNHSRFAGGALENAGILTLTNSVVYSNTAGSVAGIGNSLSGFGPGGLTGTLTLINVTVSDNTSTGAEVSIDKGSATLINTTIANNRSGGGLSFTGTSLSVQVSILADNSPRNCAQFLSGASRGFNVSDDNSCVFIQPGDKAPTDHFSAR